MAGKYDLLEMDYGAENGAKKEETAEEGVDSVDASVSVPDSTLDDRLQVGLVEDTRTRNLPLV